MAGNLLMNISQGERERAIYRSCRKFQTDLQSDLATAEDRGAYNSKIQIARNALQMGMAIDDIAKLTGLAHDEIERLKN